MPGRQLIPEEEFVNPWFGPTDPDMVRRREVIRETIECFSNADPPNKYQQLASNNLQRWKSQFSASSDDASIVLVLDGDWGDVTLAMTKRFGECFAALNMANAYVPGGAYIEGAPAQEENMFRRTDCHFYIGPDEYDRTTDQYHRHMTDLLSGKYGRVFLDVENPRVCIRGAEDCNRSDLGYAWLSDDEIFPFYELRASAQDLRSQPYYSETEGRKRIAAQLDTLIEKSTRHAVLGASGCGAFMNPTQQVAALYREEIDKRKDSFDVIAFAIFNPGYGPDNLTPFQNAFE